MEEPSAEDETKDMDVPKEEEEPVLTAEAEDQQDDAVEKTEEDAVAESVAEGTETTDAVASEENMADAVGSADQEDAETSSIEHEAILEEDEAVPVADEESTPIVSEIKEKDMESESEKDVEEAVEDVNLQDQGIVIENSSSSSSEELKKSVMFETDSSADSDPTADHSSIEMVRIRASGVVQILALMRKNVLTKFRSPAATFFELFSPVMMMLILAAASTLSEVAEFDADIYVNPVLSVPGPWLGLFLRSADLFGGDFNLNNPLGRRRKLAEENSLQTSSYKKMPSSWEGIFEGLQDKLEIAMKGHAKNLAADELDEGYSRRLQQVRNRVETSDDEQAASYKLLDEADDELEELLKGPIPTPSFSAYVSASTALSTAIPIDSLPRIFSESSFGRQWGNLLTLGTLHLSPRNEVAEQFWSYLNETYPLVMTTAGSNATILRVRVHDDEVAALDFIDKNNLNERTWALLDFSQFNLEEESSAFKIRMNYTTVPNTARITRWASIGLNDRYQRYYLSGYMTLQRTINEFAMAQSGCEEDLSSIISAPMPTAAYSQNPFFLQVGYLLGFTMVMAFLYPTSRLIKTIVEEKETKMKETLLILGVRGWAHWLSWFISSLVVFFIITVSVTFTLTSTVLVHSNPVYIFLYVLLFSTSNIGFCFAIASFFSRAKLAGIIGPVALFATILPRFVFFGSNRYENTSGQMIASLCPATAFCFGADIISDYEYAEQGIQSWNSGEGDYSFDTTLAFLFLDTLLYIFLGWYLDQVVPQQYGVARPFYFLFTPSYWLGSCTKKPPPPAPVAGAEEGSDVEEVKDISLIPKVQISNLVKQYFKGKTAYPPAVDGLNLLMYESQISALLGHNGAGKTTTVSILTGLFPPTSGDCIMYGNSIVHNKHEARQSLGICPQHNVLFGDLTVYEHLAFFMRIKGLHPDKAKILAHAEEIGLTDYLRTTASALSGGNKRKLSVAIALCGDPDVLILDEPTSAMDPHSRRAVWELLRAKKKGRVTLLTTHFMDEAELLSDRIAVMKDGKLQCCGSPMFLKTRFGLGYSITVVLEPPMSAADEEAGEEASEENSFSKQRQRLADFLNERIPHTKLVRTSGKEVTFRFPQGSESMFQSTFDDLEVQKESLCIGAYGIQNSSLEEVFLQLAEDESAVEEGDVDGLQEQPATDAVDDTFDCEYSHLSPLRQIGLLYGKRLTIQRRDKKGACFAIILPVLVIALVLVILMVEPPYVGNSLEMSPGIYRTSSAGEVDSATNIAIGGRASGATGDATFSEELGLLKDGISKRYKNTEFTSDSGASSSMDMSEYLLDTYNNRDHATRFGAYVMNDVINLTLIIDLASAASELNTDFVFDGVTNVTGSNNVDLIALSGLRDEDGMFRLNIDFASLGSMATNFVGISPNVTFNASELTGVVEASLETMLSDNNSTNLTLEAIDMFLNATFFETLHGNETHENSTSAVNITEGVGSNLTATNVTEGDRTNGTEVNVTEGNIMQDINVTALTEYIQSTGSFDRNILVQAIDSLLSGIADSVGFAGDFVGLPSGAELLNLVDSVTSQLNENASSSDTTNALAIASAIVLRESLKEANNVTINVGEFLDGFFASLLSSPLEDFPIQLDGALSIQASNMTLKILPSLTLEVFDLNVTIGDQPFLYLPAAAIDLFLSMENLESMIPEEFVVSMEARVCILHNSTSDHAVAAFNQAYMEYLYGKCKQTNTVRLTSINEPLPMTSQQSIEVKTVLSIVAALFLLIPYCYIPGAFIVFLVKERISKSKHLQLVSGVNMTSYWLATYLWDMSLFLLLTIFIMAVFLAYGNESAQVFVGDAESFFATAALTFGYGLSVLPFSYLLARNFSNPSTAQISVIGLVFISGFVAVNAYFIMSTLENTQAAAESLHPLFRLWPAFNVGEGFIELASAFWEREILFSEKRPFDWDVTGNSIALLYGLGPVYFLILLFLEYSEDGGSGGFAGRVLRQIKGTYDRTMLAIHGVREVDNKLLLLDDGLVDTASNDDVKKEADFVRSKEDLHVSAPIVLRDLWKIFPPSVGVIGALAGWFQWFLCCCGLGKSKGSKEENARSGPRRAVRGLTVAVQRGETFGLLGANGAGKTTTLGMLTGDIAPSGGEAYVAGHDITGVSPGGVQEARKNIGFCPQIDPLLGLMTGRETLRMFGKLRGIPTDKIDGVVDSLLDKLTLTPHADKTAESYSGGNKRKLSLGIAALVGDGGVLLIDECSSGLDPLARKKLWRLIEKLAIERSVVITTHSMEEAEALCSRIGIMARGQFVALGTVQHLKTKHLDGYTIDISCASNTPERSIESIVEEICKNVVPGSKLAERYGKYLKFEVSKVSTIGLGVTFHRLQELKETEGIVENYSISQCSLEQVFIKLVKDSKEEQHASSPKDAEEP